MVPRDGEIVSRFLEEEEIRSTGEGTDGVRTRAPVPFTKDPTSCLQSFSGSGGVGLGGRGRPPRPRMHPHDPPRVPELADLRQESVVLEEGV